LGQTPTDCRRDGCALLCLLDSPLMPHQPTAERLGILVYMMAEALDDGEPDNIGRDREGQVTAEREVDRQNQRVRETGVRYDASPGHRTDQNSARDLRAHRSRQLCCWESSVEAVTSSTGKRFGKPEGVKRFDASTRLRNRRFFRRTMAKRMPQVGSERVHAFGGASGWIDVGRIPRGAWLA
jgi:hypothetical protein